MAVYSRAEEAAGANAKDWRGRAEAAVNPTMTTMNRAVRRRTLFPANFNPKFHVIPDTRNQIAKAETSVRVCYSATRHGGTEPRKITFLNLEHEVDWRPKSIAANNKLNLYKVNNSYTKPNPYTVLLKENNEGYAEWKAVAVAQCWAKVTCPMTISKRKNAQTTITVTSLEIIAAPEYVSMSLTKTATAMGPVKALVFKALVKQQVRLQQNIDNARRALFQQALLLLGNATLDRVQDRLN